MRLILVFLIIIGCAPLEKPRTPQQKNLTPVAFETITQAVDDPEIIFYEDDSLEEVEPKIGAKFRKKISLSATEETNIRQILTQMASLAGVNIFISNDVQGTISFFAKERPFIDILQDVCESLDLKYTIKNDSVKVEIDSPMIKVYNVQFLNIQRDMQSSVSVSTDIFTESKEITGNSSEGSNTISTGGNNNGSSSLVTGLTKNDFWQELENSLKTIVGTEEQNYVSIHRQGGIVTIYASQKKQKAVQKYLKLLKESTELQVLIEAKILEVNLDDEFKSGINWNILRANGAFASREFGKEAADYFSFGVNRANLNVVARLIEKFGAVKTLSSPRITVLNNQSAVLKVAQNEVIYMPSLQRQYATTVDNRSTDFLSTNLHTIPIGLIMSVVPSIDRKTNSIILNLRPTISRVVRYKEVPFVYQMSIGGIAANKSTNTNSIHKIPIVDVREFDSVLRLQSGQVVVMGGLMQEKSSNNRAGLPDFPETDAIFGEREKSTEITELVIFLKATIIRRKRKNFHNADKKFYKTYANDPRPLEFKK